MLVEQFPDNPIALEGLNVLYLNSEKAIDLKLEQVTALLGWVRGGGHLIVAIENPGDVNGTPWLRQFLPAEFNASANTRIDRSLMDWLKADPDDPKASTVVNPCLLVEVLSPWLWLGGAIAEVDPRYLRPTEVDHLVADASKAREKLGWRPRTGFDELVEIMVESDLKNLDKK